jgi:monoamine oxidase
MAGRRGSISPTSTTDVVVIGGGLAGLVAAVTLAPPRASVQLLETQGRVGGRVLTLRRPFGDGLYAEAGGEFIAPSHRMVHRFLRDYRLPMHTVGSGPRLSSIGGVIRRGAALADLGAEARADAGRIERCTRKLAERVTDPRRPWAAPGAAEIDDRSLGEWLDELGVGPVARAYQQVWTTVDYGVEPARLSLLQFARDERLLMHAPDWEAARVRGGMDRLPEAMAAELGERITSRTRVTGLAHDRRGVTVRYQRDGIVGHLQASYAVVALPLTVLRALEVDPPFDPRRRQAIAELPSSRVMKVLLQFRRRFWEDQGVNGRTFTDGSLQATYDATHGQPGRRAILTVYLADQVARLLATMTEEQRIAHCLGELERLYPGCGADLETGVSVVWDTDPSSLGAYSYFRPGDVTRFGPVLARPEGRIHFAGEHTDPWQATMNGALSSGVRAAREVVARLPRGTGTGSAMSPATIRAGQ